MNSACFHCRRESIETLRGRPRQIANSGSEAPGPAPLHCCPTGW